MDNDEPINLLSDSRLMFNMSLPPVFPQVQQTDYPVHNAAPLDGMQERVKGTNEFHIWLRARARAVANVILHSVRLQQNTRKS